MRSLPRVLGVAAALFLAPLSSFGEAPPSANPPDEPWGYLYLFRTLQLYPLTLDETVIGRLNESNIVLTSPRVSRRHAVVRHVAEEVELVDVGSSNGTRRNGEPLRARAPVALSPGDRIELADEIVLYHVSLPELWRDELRHRLLARIVKLRKQLPEDATRKSFGREETVSAVSEARVSSETGEVDLEHSVPLDPEAGFPEGAGAFVGNVGVNEGVLELSLWTISAGESMTSRRSSFSNLKHATLKVSVAEKKSDGTEESGTLGPWFPPEVLAAVFEVFPDEAEFSLQFATSLASQERPLALSDAAASLWFRHRLEPSEWKLLLMAAEAKGLWVDREIGERGLSLGAEDKNRLEAALEEARAWLSRARELGAKEEPGLKAEDALTRAGERLSRIQGTP